MSKKSHIYLFAEKNDKTAFLSRIDDLSYFDMTTSSHGTIDELEDLNIPTGTICYFYKTLSQIVTTFTFDGEVITKEYILNPDKYCKPAYFIHALSIEL